MASPALQPNELPTYRQLLARLASLCWQDQGFPNNPEITSQELITRLAYALWEERGRPEGSADADWLEAEGYVRELFASEAVAS